ncbi:MAG: NAD(P)/FAD-dependent oxidoreductase [Desulfurella sp.]
MRRLVILGGGAGGTMMLNKFYNVLDRNEWQFTIIDEYETHYYQPGFLFIPFNMYTKRDVIRPKRDFLPPGVEFILEKVKVIDPEKNRVILDNNAVVPYDYLIIATGCKIDPNETEGLNDTLWHKNIFDFYTIEGALKLANFFRHFDEGKLVLHITEMPIKCPVAPLEFVFLADWFFTKKGVRDKVEISFVTPLPGAFTKPKAASVLGDFLQKKNIHLIPDFSIEYVDNKNKQIVSFDGIKVDFDCLVSIPTNKGDKVIAESGLGNELNFIPTDKETLLAKGFNNIFVIGDAADLPTSKAGSVAHFASDILFENFLDVIEGKPPKAKFDGHANCFIESGFGKGILIDFNYDVEPLPGKFPLPALGPFSLLQETAMNHYGKIMFRWMYWNYLLKGVELPIESHMSMAGKRA